MSQPKGLSPRKIIIKARCPCGHRIRVTIFDEGKALDRWEVACQNHKKMHLKVILGHIHATGSPSDPDAAAAVVHRAIRDKVPVVRTTDHEPFVYKVRF